MLEKEETVTDGVEEVNAEGDTKETPEAIDPLEGILYFIIPKDSVTIVNQAINLIPDEMVVLKGSITDAINSVMQPITQEVIDRAEKEFKEQNS